MIWIPNLNFLIYRGMTIDVVLSHYVRTSSSIKKFCKSVRVVKLEIIGDTTVNITKNIEYNTMSHLFDSEHLESLSITSCEETKTIFEIYPGRKILVHGEDFNEFLAPPKFYKNVFESCSMIEELVLTDASFIPARDIKSFLIQCSSSLKIVKILFHDAICELIELILQCTNLEHLHLGAHGRITNPNSLEGLRKLRLSSLCLLGFHNIPIDIYIEIFSRMEPWNNLTELQLWHCVTVNDLCLFAIGLSCCKLDTLSISTNNSITDFGVMKCCLLCPKLNKLQLDNLVGVVGYFLIYYVNRLDRMAISLHECGDAPSRFIAHIVQKMSVK